MRSLANHPTPVGLPTALEEIWCRLHQQCVHDPWCCRYTLASSVLQCHHLQHMCIVLAREAREGPNTQGQAGRFMAETGHHLEEVMANCHPPWYCWKGDWQDHSTPRGSFSTPLEAGEESHRRDLSSVFMTVGDTDTFWHLQFFSTVTFEFEEDPVTHTLSCFRTCRRNST